MSNHDDGAVYSARMRLRRAAGTLFAVRCSIKSLKWVQVAGLQRSMAYGARVMPESVTSLPACLAKMYSSEGLRGLYKGSLPSILKAAPSAAVTFTAYEFVLGALTVFWADRANSRSQ